jgi:hypothetical protein
MPLSPEEKKQAKTIERIIIYLVVNVFACYFIPHFLAWAHYVINGLFIPRRFFYSVTRPNQDMTPLYSLMLFIVTAELIGLLIALHRFNTGYSIASSSQRLSLIAWLTTIVVGVVTTSLTIKEFWYLLEKF